MLDESVKKDIISIIAVVCGLSILSAVIIIILTEQGLSRERDQILQQKQNAANGLSSRLELRIQDAVKILQLAASSKEFSNSTFAATVSIQYKGIMPGLEQDKKSIATNLLKSFQNFQTVSFVLPNGNVYFVEPYDQQLALPRLNFADRDWYQGAMATGQPYVAGALISAATGNRVVPIAVPVYSSTGQLLNGFIVGALNLAVVDQQLKSELDLSNNNRVVFIDEKGNTIEDVHAGGSENYTSITSLNTQSVHDVLAGNAGNKIEQIGGVETIVVYSPVDIITHKWGVLLLQPTKDAFSTIDYWRAQTYLIIAVIVGIISASGYVLAAFRKRSAIAKQLEKANCELLEKNKLKDEFIKIASHELKTPIQPILGYASLAGRGLVENNTAWKVVHGQAKKLMKLTNNIMDISMIQSGVFKYEMMPVSIPKLLQSAVDSIRPEAMLKGLSLELEVDPKVEDVKMKADCPRLEYVFLELLDNAMKFTAKGGIHVAWKFEHQSELIVTITDTGTAIPEDMLPRLFSMFTSRSFSDPTIQGAGLGLFICKAIVEAHAGSITARNNTNMAGATFEVRLRIDCLSQQQKATNPSAVRDTAA